MSTSEQMQYGNSMIGDNLLHDDVRRQIFCRSPKLMTCHNNAHVVTVYNSSYCIGTDGYVL